MLEALAVAIANRNWEAARAEADHVRMLCWQRQMEENPPVRLRVSPCYLRPPSARINAVLRRISFRRILWYQEHEELAERMAKKWSRMPRSTMRGCSLHNISCFLWRGNQIVINQGRDYEKKKWDALIREAKESGAQFCDINSSRLKVWRQLYRRETNYLETRKVINKLKKELQNGKELASGR